MTSPHQGGGRAAARTPRRRAHALELILDAAGDAAVRQRWADLEAAGVPSAARHTGATHRPHLTLLSGPGPSEESLTTARALVVPLLPLPLPVVGLVLLGAPTRPALAELLAVPEALRSAREELRGAWPGADDRDWVPHLTLAQRVGPGSLTDALSGLGASGDAGSGTSTARLAGPGAGTGPDQRRVVALRWWDPDREVVTPLGGDL